MNHDKFQYNIFQLMEFGLTGMTGVFLIVQSLVEEHQFLEWEPVSVIIHQLGMVEYPVQVQISRRKHWCVRLTLVQVGYEFMEV